MQIGTKKLRVPACVRRSTILGFRLPGASCEKARRDAEKGFSLIEVVLALVVLLVALLGVFLAFTWAIIYNAGNNSRSQALAIMQQQVEKMRSGKFTPTVIDSALSGGVQPVKTVILPNNNRFRVNIVVDDDPFAAGVQVDNTTTVKEVTVAVSLDRPTPGWQASVPAVVILRRVRAN
ncbi:MAG: prepilin-type N-terminal cleavage/methylation domain-containing protein [Acidobacteriota bacterium]|nr:prepilin-type N-terminal cleavage/methylation domain-containing protein [Acidobacteriota bacterium]MDH3528821.1 prepilin-type N-terminal cleavage/methylation domain-containing protein [Acidobacteriota bacterium]